MEAVYPYTNQARFQEAIATYQTGRPRNGDIFGEAHAAKLAIKREVEECLAALAPQLEVLPSLSLEQELDLLVRIWPGEQPVSQEARDLFQTLGEIERAMRSRRYERNILAAALIRCVSRHTDAVRNLQPTLEAFPGLVAELIAFLVGVTTCAIWVRAYANDHAIAQLS